MQKPDEFILKPCPFCGAKAFIWHTYRTTYIECERFSPEHEVMIRADTDKEAFEIWNTRKGGDNK